MRMLKSSTCRTSADKISVIQQMGSLKDITL